MKRKRADLTHASPSDLARDIRALEGKASFKKARHLRNELDRRCMTDRGEARIHAPVPDISRIKRDRPRAAWEDAGNGRKVLRCG